jgi:hypothetical protein
MEEAEGEEETMEEGDDEEIDMNEIIGALSEEADEESEEMDEDIDINEIIRSLREEDETEEKEMKEEEEEKEMESSEDLEEAYNVIRFLKGKINEVNLLNAKLLYSNKLFRNFSLNEGQKMKVIENFDRAFTLREVKLVYSTLAEGFKMPSTRKVVKESFASKPIASTKPARQIISESATGIAIAYACSVGENSGDTELGGFYTYSLLKEALQWYESQNKKGILSINEANELAHHELKFKTNFQQNPQIRTLNAQTEKLNLPFSIKTISL